MILYHISTCIKNDWQSDLSIMREFIDLAQRHPD